MNESEKEELIQRIRQQEHEISELKHKNEGTLGQLRRSWFIACVLGSVFFTLLCMSNMTHFWERIFAFVFGGVSTLALYAFATAVVPLVIEQWLAEPLSRKNRFTAWLSKHMIEIITIIIVVFVFVAWNYRVYY